MERKSFEHMSCSVAQTLEVIGEWWTMLIVRDAFLGVQRFDEFQTRLGIARNVLAQRLNKLVEAGVLERRAYQEKPVRHAYVLTERGRDLWPVLNAMRQWGDRHAAPDGPPVEVVHRGCGHAAELVLTCTQCGERVGPRDVRAQRGPGAPLALRDVPLGAKHEPSIAIKQPPRVAPTKQHREPKASPARGAEGGRSRSSR